MYYTSDKKMLELMQILKDSGKITTQKDFCDAVGILPPNLWQIKNPDGGRPQHFTPVHIQNACRKWKVNTNWIFGLSDDVWITETVKK